MAGDQFMVSLYYDAGLAALPAHEADAARDYLQRRIQLRARGAAQAPPEPA